jgi:hypothetical protein
VDAKLSWLVVWKAPNHAEPIYNPTGYYWLRDVLWQQEKKRFWYLLAF